MRLGILTGGGDCPGLNAVIRAIVRKGENHYGDTMIGFLDAWDGLLEGRTMPLEIASLRGMLPRGGTLLGTRRGSPYDLDDGLDRVREAVARHKLDGLIAIGGNGTLWVADRLHQDVGLAVIGVPKTIDNDVVGTDITFGFNTAVQIATDAIDRLHTTAESHNRVMIVEVMGRDTGWIATHAGIAGGATAIIVPEEPFDIVGLCELLLRRHERGRYASIVVVAEGSKGREGAIEPQDRIYDQFGRLRHGGIANAIGRAVARRIDYETRVVLLGHLQRGGTPTAFDRVLSTTYGLAAIDAAHHGEWGKMVAVRNNEMTTVNLRDVAGKTRTLDMGLYHGVAEVFFG